MQEKRRQEGQKSISPKFCIIFKMEIISLTQDKEKLNASFILRKADPVIANTLRRLMIEEVPTMAIEDVELVKNSSILYDEIIAHRMGLLPIKTDLKSYFIRDECKCDGKGCARCTLQMTLKSKSGMVYASDIKSKDPNVVPVYPKTPIVKLLKGQEIEVLATAQLGKGKDHVKWAPCLAWYKYKPIIVINNSKIKDADAVVNVCPRGVLVAKSGKVEVDKNKLLSCDLCAACADKAPDGVKLNEKDDEFVFYVESFGQLKVKEIVTTAIDMLKKDLSSFKDALEAMK